MKKIVAIIVKIRKLLKHKRNVSLEHHLINPERDWRLIITVFALGLIASAFSHYIIYMKLDVAPLDITNEPPVTRFLLKDELAKTVTEYRAKEANLNALLQKPPAVVDPSK